MMKHNLNKGVAMNSAELRATVIGWLNEIKVWWPETGQKWEDYFYTDDELLEYRWGGKRNIPKENISSPSHLHLLLWTDNHEYHLSFHPPCGEKDEWGIVPYAHSRKKRAGESWTRMNDLPDGSFSRDQFFTTMLKIVSWELVAKVKPPQRRHLAAEPGKDEVL